MIAAAKMHPARSIARASAGAHAVEPHCAHVCRGHRVAGARVAFALDGGLLPPFRRKPDPFGGKASGQLIEFGEDLREHWNEARPNLFVNTPDILHESLQHGGPGMFGLRAALAATLSPTWGVYSGYELFEHEAVKPGSEEYLNSEKYQLRPRDYARALADGRSLEPWLRKLNHIRKAHPALQQMRTLKFQHIENDALVAFSKRDPETGDTVVVVVSLDPHNAQEGTLYLDLPALGFDWHERVIAHDEVTGETWDWGQANYVRLEPWRATAHVVSLQRRFS